VADPQAGQHDTAAMATEPRDRNQDPDMRVVVWQWGRYGAGPRLAALLAEGFEALGGIATILSLSSAAEILRGPHSPRCDLPVQTYAGLLGLAWRFVRAPATVVQLSRRLRRLAPRIGVCAMPGPLDLLMVMALRRVGVPVAVVVHDAQAHPGDEFPLLFRLQRALLRRVNLVIALSEHVASRVRTNCSLHHRVPVIVLALPPLAFGPVAPSGAHTGPRRVLCFGRLRAYKGLDLLAEALRLMGPRPDMEVRVVGQGPESTALADLRALPCVKVENRWVPECEVSTILNWADVVVLPYREASQSGIAPTALAAGRRVVATRVGGLSEQLESEPLATLCEPDAASLAAALLSTLENSNDIVAPAVDAHEAWRGFADGVLAGLEPLIPKQKRGPHCPLVE
jgi:glycosyltransferase involved in cell wall biosynthesis